MKKILSRFICLLLALSMILGTPVSVKAYEDDEPLDLSEIYAFDRHNEKLLFFESSAAGEITYKRTHTKASTGVRYATKYLIMSAKPISFSTTDITQNISPFEAKPTTPYVIVPFSKEPYNFDDKVGHIETTYYFENEELNDVAKRLGIDDATDGKIDGFVEIYVTHVFEIAPANQSA